ncbi:MFS transporter [uncultured Friedmanniella sp.]|uniref:MFS transporter n=1 Tax=uncultured Friedmanniella sp. TaxID=335381 RepID=UPI0035CA3349
MTAPVSAVAPTRARLRLLLVALALALLLSELDQTVFATALPTVVGELDGVGDMLWVNTAYVLAGTVTMPLYGRLSDLIGRRPLLLAGLLVFLAGSVVGGLAPSMAVLITARTVQGLGAGGMIILVQAVVADAVPARERAAYLSAVAAVFAVAAVLGPVLGGWLTEGPGWRWAFWVNLPVGGLALVAVAVLLHEPPRNRARLRPDVAGFGLLTLAVTAVVLLASWAGTRFAWGSPAVLGLAVVAVLATAAFVAVERRAAEPVLPLSLFADRTFRAAVLAGLAMAVAMFGTVGYLPTYLQMVTGLGPTAAGLAMLSLVAGIGLCTVGSARLVRRTGRYRTLTLLGSVLTAVALALLATLTPATPLPLTAGYLFGLGAGIGCAWEVLVVVVQNSSPPSLVGTATAANSFLREIGVCLGSAVVGAAFTSRLARALPVTPEDLTPERVRLLPPEARAGVATAYNDALTPVFGWLVPVMLLAVLALVALREVPLRSILATMEEPAEER